MNAPTPDPMTWDETADVNGLPHELEIDDANYPSYYVAVEMTATTAEDDSDGTIEYFFWCTSNSGFNSGWIEDTTYNVIVGRSGLGLKFRVKARDQYGNETAWSPEARTLTLTEVAAFEDNGGTTDDNNDNDDGE